MTLQELKRQRSNLSVKICDWKKKGKDVTELQKQIQDLVAQINAQKEAIYSDVKKPSKPRVQIPEGERQQLREQALRAKLKNSPKKSWKKTELESCERTIQKILEDNDWYKGYQFRSSECMYIKDINTNIGDNCVELTYILQYKTKVRRVENTITKQFTPDTLNSLQKYIDDMELWVMKNSGDMDDKQIVFGVRFNKVQFEKQKMEKLGWKIYK